MYNPNLRQTSTSQTSADGIVIDAFQDSAVTFPLSEVHANAAEPREPLFTQLPARVVPEVCFRFVFLLS